MYEKEYIYEEEGGPKLYHKRKVLKKIIEKWVPVHHYRQVEAEWYRDFLGEVKLARAAAHMTQQEMARELRTSQSWYSTFECGRVNPTVDFIRRVAKVLDKEIRIILT